MKNEVNRALVAKTRYFRLVLIALVSIAFIGCEMFDKKTESFSQSDLHGLWLEEGTQHYVRFLSEKADTSTFEWGKEWDVAQKVTEDKLVYHGNGWFKYELKENKLKEIHMMDNDGAVIYQGYVVTLLTGKRLEYYKEGYKNEKQYYNKVVQ